MPSIAISGAMSSMASSEYAHQPAVVESVRWRRRLTTSSANLRHPSMVSHSRRRSGRFSTRRPSEGALQIVKYVSLSPGRDEPLRSQSDHNVIERTEKFSWLVARDLCAGDPPNDVPHIVRHQQRTIGAERHADRPAV